MGAYSTVCALDHARLREVIAPAVRRLLLSGAPGPLAPLLEPELEPGRIARARVAISPAASRALLAGLGVDLARDCRVLDDELGVHPDLAARPASVVPSWDGACGSTTCAAAAVCPMNVAQGGPVGAEPFGRLVQQAVLSCCMSEPADLVLGRHFTMERLGRWLSWEEGDDDIDMASQPRQGPVAELLVRLCRRGAAWGWGDGGHGEGLLGWLAPREAAALANLLAAYDLEPSASVSATLDEYTRGHLLPETRALVARFRGHLVDCARRGLGVLLRRD